MRAIVLAGMLGCRPEVGGACEWSEETYGTTCSDGRLLSCEAGVWVDIGTELRPDYDDPDILGGPICVCASPNHVECTYDEY